MRHGYKSDEPPLMSLRRDYRNNPDRIGRIAFLIWSMTRTATPFADQHTDAEERWWWARALPPSGSAWGKDGKFL